MMESIRTGVQKPWIKVLLAIVVISFIFAGYFTGGSFGSSADAVAEVNGQEVKRSEWDRSVNIQASRYGEQFNMMFSTEERRQQFRLNVLDSLVSSKLVEQKVLDYGFSASGQQVVSEIKDVPVFQEEGKFSTARLDDYLRSQGLSRAQFQRDVANNIAMTQFTQLFTDTEIALENEAVRKLLLEKQQRDVKSVTIPAQKFLDSVDVTEADVESYYQANMAQYMLPESLTVDYIELKVADTKTDITVPDEEVEQYYQSNQDRYRKEEQRQVAHILITTEERSKEEAKEKVDALKQQLDQGADFAELAKAESDDFTADQGGDLGVISRGVMEESFENAMFQLSQVGDVSPVVETSFGFHIIKLLNVEQGEVRPLSEVRDEIIAMLKQDKAEAAFFKVQQKVKELAFEKYDSLTAAAAEAGVEVQTSTAFPPTGGQGIFANPELVAEAYGDKVLVNKRNSSLIEVADGHFVVLRANTHNASRTQSLEEVRTEVTASVRQQKASEKAKETGLAIKEKLENLSSAADLLASLELEWKEAKNIRRNSTELGFEVTQLAFKAPKPDVKPSIVSKEALNGDFILVQVVNVQDFDASKLTEAEKSQAIARIKRGYTDTSYASFVGALKDDAEIVKFQERIEQQ